MTAAIKVGIAVGFLTSLAIPANTGAGPFCGQFLAGNTPDVSKTISVTILVEGMMKSRSGAT